MIGSRTSYGGIRRASHAEGCVCRSSEPDRAEAGVAEDTITITISREDAKWWKRRDYRAVGEHEDRIADACRAALEALDA